MKKIRMNDTVELPDGATGKVLDVLITSGKKAYKIERSDTHEIQYFDHTKVLLKKRHIMNFIASLFSRKI